mmetsp:Transcript_47704/g.85886  ORF Transcript_47704/g.85886 Transcript_47704/m.85886 type:complete len:256 (-) Transcript_47704:103-870(-)|eukprot:CAMPEP_0197659898 /NCGR_PEP_ID=MMETSP1338-20131121/49626_1 /TAXON_ID=43686 ORGANISM="Pelagodinium beii, Strain RCC1491" /NCGR_SAMPLE_ID=MMETSP1338 /ASSEMBLY_ACC=CAM_ASM_000754 /LENGTH=255 /DNA_ID=CAMNT_0043237073 /DNA_START=61 /DNA_END=828 /DNA_ORIENTATION=+
MEDFYVILGVSRDASEADVKKAYRKEALKWHPDKNPDNKENAEARFKAVAEAYEVLSNPEKRRLYDMGGKEAVNGGGGGGGGHGYHGFHQGHPGGMGHAFDIFEQFFGGRDPFAEMDRMFAEMQQGPGMRGGMRGGSMGGMGSMFDDDFFNSGFGAPGGGGASFSSFSSSSMGGGGGGMMTSTSTTTRTVNGKRVTVTEKTVRQPDGTVTKTRSETADDGSASAGGMLGNDPFADFFGGGSRSNRGSAFGGRLGF